MAKENKIGPKDRQAFILRIAPDILKALEQWAADDFRSMNGQVEYLLNDALKRAGRIKKQDK